MPRRTTDPSHTDTTMWPKHAAETSAAGTKGPCCPRGFHVHAWSKPRICLHHAHFVPCAPVEHLLRRVPRASIATHREEKETGSSREKLSGENFFCAQRNPEISISAQHQGQSPPTRYAQHLPARRASLIRKTVADSIAYRRVPKTYLSVQDRELLSAHTKRPARNGHYSKTFNAVGLLTTACAWHGVHTPAHQVSKNRPRKSSSQITNTAY